MAPARFLFRVAAGPRIGFGHLMRVRALARALNVPPLVSLRGGARARRTVVRLGFQLADGVDLASIDVVIVDDPSTRQANAWLIRAKRAGAATVTIHDFGTGGRAADLLIDGRLNARPFRGHATTLCGPRFAILHPRLLAARATRRLRRAPRRPRVLIALGGGSHVFSVVQPLVHDIARRCPGAVILCGCRVLSAAPAVARHRALARTSGWFGLGSRPVGRGCRGWRRHALRGVRRGHSDCGVGARAGAAGRRRILRDPRRRHRCQCRQVAGGDPRRPGRRGRGHAPGGLVRASTQRRRRASTC